MDGYRSGDRQDALSVGTAQIGGASVVTVGGEIDVHTVPQLRAELRDVLAGPHGGPIFVDLTAVTFIGSAGLAILVDSEAEAQQRGRRFGLVVDHSGTAVILALQTVGLTGLFATYSDLDDALAR